jgi:hypothetical protein
MWINTVPLHFTLSYLRCFASLTELHCITYRLCPRSRQLLYLSNQAGKPKDKCNRFEVLMECSDSERFSEVLCLLLLHFLGCFIMAYFSNRNKVSDDPQSSENLLILAVFIEVIRGLPQLPQTNVSSYKPLVTPRLLLFLTLKFAVRNPVILLIVT